MTPLLIVLCLVALGEAVQVVTAPAQKEIARKQYLPTWDSLDERPLPDWYDRAKIGIFIHWGIFSVPSYGSEWFWSFWHDNSTSFTDFMAKNYPPSFTYQDFAKDFTAEFYDPTQWAKLFHDSGAKYVVLTSKHHEGYTLWPSNYSYSWNAMDVGPHKDLVGELEQAIRKETNLHFGLYHSMMEWFHPLYVNDKANAFNTSTYPEYKPLPELYEITNTYKPDVIWSDGVREASDTYWGTREFLAWLYNSSPVRDTVVVNDRWAKEAICIHGDFITCVDKFNPGEIQKRKWENAMSLDMGSFGYRRSASLSDYMPIKSLIKEIISTVSYGGNILINIGPTKEGTIPVIYEERLRQMGEWLAVNGEAIYETKLWLWQNDTITPNVWYTARNDLDAVYATFMDWPEDNQMKLYYNETLFSNSIKVAVLGAKEILLKWYVIDNTAFIELPPKSIIKSEWAWVLSFNF